MFWIFIKKNPQKKVRKNCFDEQEKSRGHLKILRENFKQSKSKIFSIGQPLQPTFFPVFPLPPSNYFSVATVLIQSHLISVQSHLVYIQSHLIYIFNHNLLVFDFILHSISFSQKQPSEKETPTQVLSCECCGIFKNTYFEEHLRTTASFIRRWFVLHLLLVSILCAGSSSFYVRDEFLFLNLPSATSYI